MGDAHARAKKSRSEALLPLWKAVKRFVAKEPANLSFSIAVPRGKQRFRELIIYVSQASKVDGYFGAIKLNKILYYSDFRAFERFGAPLTGVPYFKLPHGPAPYPLLPIRRELVREKAIEIQEVMMGDFVQERTVALRNPYLTLFSEDEIALVDEVIKDLWNQTATEVSDASHDVRWRTLIERDFLPYEFAFLDDEITVEDEERTQSLARELGW